MWQKSLNLWVLEFYDAAFFFFFVSTCKVNRYIWAVYVGNYQFNITAAEMQLS